MKDMNKDFKLLILYLKNNCMSSITNRFMDELETQEVFKKISPTDFELLMNFFCFIYKIFTDRLNTLKEYMDSTENQIDAPIVKSVYKSQKDTLDTLHGWIKTLCEETLKFFNITDEENSERLVPLVISDGMEQLKRYAGSKKTQKSDMIEILKAQKNIENSQVLPDAKMDEILAKLQVSFTGLERYFSRIGSQDTFLDPFLEEFLKHKKEIDANTMVKNQKMTAGRFFQNMLGGR